MSKLYLSGSAEQNSTDELLLKDQIQGMGSAITGKIGSLAWIEAFAISRALNAALNFVELMGNQLSPNSMSVFADRFAAIYGIAARGNGIVPKNLHQIQQYIGLKEAVFGTPPTLSAVTQYISVVLGQLFIDIEYIDNHVQSAATMSPLTTGQPWVSPLSTLLVRIWQPRDNQDNLLMQTATFLTTANSYKGFVQPWLPADIAVQNMQLIYNGNDGYGSYATAQNVVSATSGSHSIVGISTAFTTDLSNVSIGYQMPIEIVDDLNQLHTYHISAIANDTHVTTVEQIVNNITNRTYRLLGIQMDVPYALDTMMFNV